MKEFLEFVIRNLVEFPDELVITEFDRDRTILFNLELRKSDVGKVIGKQGQTIAALRTLLNAAASRHNKRVQIEILEEPA